MEFLAILKYANADLKIFLYVRLDTKVIPVNSAFLSYFPLKFVIFLKRTLRELISASFGLIRDN